MTFLLTGFDAFGDIEVNSSQLVIEAIAEAEHEGVVTAVLPTSYRQAGQRIQELIRAHKPDRVLMLGLAGKASAISLEQTALNLNDCASPDNDGEVRTRQKIADDGPVGYWSTLPLEQMAGIARRLGQQVEFSRDAGAFVCNHVFFTAARTVASELPGCLCGFVHLPPIIGAGDELAAVTELVRAWIADGLRPQSD